MARVVQRNCDQCGAGYEAKRRDSRFCGGVCRNKHRRSPTARSEAPAEGFTGSLPDILPPLVATVAAELDAAGRRNTTKGQLVLYLATALTTATLFDNLSQRAAATREIRASLDAALAGAPRPADTVDELEQRRREKAARAGL